MLNSLDEVNPEIEAAWGEEIVNRIQAIDEGRVTLVPVNQLLQRLKNR